MPLYAVVPASSSLRSLNVFAALPRSSRVLRRVNTLWNFANISEQGEYSVVRIESLDKYCQQTPFAQVILVAVLMPVPSLVLSLLAECIPLQDPTSGWRNNPGAYLRICSIVSSGALGSIMQLRTVIKISSFGAILVVLGTGCGTAGLMIMMAYVWVFPIPLVINILALPAVILFILLFLLLVRRQATRTTLIPCNNLRQPLYLIAAQAIIAILYTFYSVVFTRCSSAQRFALLVALPVMKTVLKCLVAQVMTENPDSLPATAVFTVDVFDGLYSSICIQTSGSWLSLYLIISLCVVQTMLSTFEINRAAKYFCLLYRRHNVKIKLIPVGKPSTRAFANGRRTSKAIQRITSTPDIQGIRGPSAAERSKMSAKLLFLLEYQALVGYTETFIPLIYAIYLTVLVHMPSSKYYPHTRSLSSTQLQTRIGCVVAYSATQLLSMVWLHLVVKRKLGFSLLYQLSFALETEVAQLQGRLLVWIILVLQISLVHFGMDFSFEFKWLT